MCYSSCMARAIGQHLLAAMLALRAASAFGQQSRAEPEPEPKPQVQPSTRAAGGQPEGPESPTFSENPVSGAWPWQSATLTSDWGGARTKLGDAGLSLAVTSTTDLATVLGGAPRTGFLMPYLVDANLSVDFEKLGVVPGGGAFVDFQQAGSTQLAANYVPDYWGWDAIYPFTQSLTQLAQYWYGQSLADGAVRLKLGKIDANVDFAVSQPNLLFINSAAYMPSVLAQDLPTFPNPAGGFEVLLKPLDWIDARFGMFDGSTNWYDPSTGLSGMPTGQQGLGGFFWNNPGSYFLISEVSGVWQADGKPGHLGVGWFQQTGSSAEPSGVRNPSPTGELDVMGAWGLYTSFNQVLFQADAAAPSASSTTAPASLSNGPSGPGLTGPGLAAFGQFGWSDPSENPSQWSIMGGMSWQGVIDARPNDTLGAMVAYGHFSGMPSLSFSSGWGETIVEGFYNFQIAPWLSVQPDVQYINQPSEMPSLDIGGAWIVTMRVVISF